MTGDGSISNGVVRFFQAHTQKPAPYFLIVSLNLRLFLSRASECAKGTLMGSTHFSISLEVTSHHMTGFSKDSFSNYLCPRKNSISSAPKPVLFIRYVFTTKPFRPVHTFQNQLLQGCLLSPQSLSFAKAAHLSTGTSPEHLTIVC